MTTPIATTFETRERLLSASLLSARAAELGVPVEQVCRECRWPKLIASGECVTAALRQFGGGVVFPPIDGRVLAASPTDAFAPCSREKPRMQRVRLEALMGALCTLGMQFNPELSPAQASRPVYEILRWAAATTVKRHRTHASSCRLIRGLFTALTVWGAVRDACRPLYPAEVLPALDTVWAAWVAYKEVA